MSLYTAARKIKDETGKTPKLICDFLNIFYWLMSEFHEAKVKCKDYQTYSGLYGGDLNEYAERFIAFVRALRQVGVDPIFFLDGERGSDLEGFNAKLETYKKRHDGRIENCNRLINLKHKGDTAHAPWIRPPMLGLHILMALKAEGVIMEHCISEADECMAQYYVQAQGDICGILTDDTDMVMMRGLEVFPCTFFDREAKLGIRTPTFNSTVTDIVYESVAPATLARILNLREDDLKDLSIICGNDYTNGLNKTHGLIKRLNFTERRRPVIENVAEWLRTTPHMALHETSPLKEICEESDGKYKEAIDHTYKAYSTCTQDPPAASCDHKGAADSDDASKKKGNDSPHYDMILEETRNGRMIRDLLSMAANSIHWRSVVIEDVDDSVTPPLKCIYDLLLPIRHLVYKLLGLQTMTEYGRSTAQPYIEIPIAVKDSDPSFLPRFRERSALERLCLLTTFLSKAHILATGSLAEFQTPLPLSCAIDSSVYLLLIKSSVLCGSLLFSYDLRRDSVFGCDHVQDVYLVTTCLCCLKLPLRKVCARPSSHSINIATGFAITIKHSYYLASLFGLHESMPLPGEMYQSAALIPFFHVATSKPSLIKHQLQVNKDPEMAETLHAYRYITQLRSFRRLTKFLEEIHCSLPSICGLIPPCTILNLAVAFMEVVADIDEANQQQLLFIQDQPIATHTDKHHKGKSMLHILK
jgi:5'-3' exonuclease